MLYLYYKPYHLGQEFINNYKEKGHYTANMKELYYIDNNIYKVPFKKFLFRKDKHINLLLYRYNLQ